MLLEAEVPVSIARRLKLAHFCQGWNFEPCTCVIVVGVEEVAMAAFFLWCILLFFCWPLALLALDRLSLCLAHLVAVSHPWHRCGRCSIVFASASFSSLRASCEDLERFEWTYPICVRVTSWNTLLKTGLFDG